MNKKMITTLKSCLLAMWGLGTILAFGPFLYFIYNVVPTTTDRGPVIAHDYVVSNLNQSSPIILTGCIIAILSQFLWIIVVLRYPKGK